MKDKNHDNEYEARHLREVCEMLRAEIAKKEKEILNHKNELVSIRKNMWENARHGFGSNETEAMIEATQYTHAIKSEERGYGFAKAMLDKYRRLILSPYFARIDFKPYKEEETEKVYIGIYSYIDFDRMEVVIHDWRAPISTVFYEYELGEAEYKTKEGIVHGEILLKRQFKIRDSKLLYMFDSSIKIDDEILQEVLSGNASDKMKNIITTIQKEQNRAIRYDEGKVLVVQGAAGSGKTSIALHRIAYLLYKDRNITSSNIIIFSPSHIFNDYISNVLPELGEKNTQQTTFAEYAGRLVSKGFKAEGFNEHMEYVLSGKKSRFKDIRWKGYRYKTSKGFLRALMEYVKDYGEKADFLKDIWYGDRRIITGEELKSVYRKNTSGSTMSKRLNAVRERALYLLAKVQNERKVELTRKFESMMSSRKEISALVRMELHKEFKAVKDIIFKQTDVNMDDIYTGFYHSRYYETAGLDSMLTASELHEIRKYTLENYRNSIQNYEDSMVMLYMKCEMLEMPNTSEIRHVVIDEAQDYSPLQYEILKRLFHNSSFTILGDLNQSINPYGHIENYDTVVQVFGQDDSAVLVLNKSYRSTRQISEFTKALLPVDVKIEDINREGKLPEIKRAEGEGNVRTLLLESVNEFIDEGMKTIAIICKTAEACRYIYRLLKNEVKLNLITKDDDLLKAGITVLPLYLCKGLEFDGVIVYDASEQNYPGKESRKLLYTACTRAQHRLTICYREDLSSVIANIDKRLYRIN